MTVVEHDAFGELDYIYVGKEFSLKGEYGLDPIIDSTVNIESYSKGAYRYYKIDSEKETYTIGEKVGDDRSGNIDRGIGKAALQEDASEPGQETAPAQAEKPSMTDFKPYVGRKRKSGTGCVTEINDHLFEGRYSPKWPDGKKHARNVYAHTREECEEKLKVLIVEMKAELAELKRQKAEGTLPLQEIEKDKKKDRKKAR